MKRSGWGLAVSLGTEPREMSMDTLAREAQEALIRRGFRLRARVSSGGTAQGPVDLTDAERQELRAIDEALTRIAEGQFGRCVRCGGAIGRHRLRAIPETRHCLTCATVVDTEVARSTVPGSREEHG